MTRRGTLKTWNAERGFGFITPEDGGADLFVHITQFPRGSPPPLVGEKLQFDVGRGRGGQVQALRVHREGETAAPARRRSSSRSSGPFTGIVLLGIVAAVGYNAWQKRQLANVIPLPLTDQSEVETPAAAGRRYRCDGRTRCPQMRSCEEAKFFLENCPGVEMDGDADGIPCEDQWCAR